MNGYGKILAAALIAGLAAPVIAQTTPTVGASQPMGYQRSSLSTSDANALRSALAAARTHWKHAKAAGVTASYWQEKARGKWEKQQ